MHKNHIIQQVLEDPGVRIATARESLEWFFNVYLNAFITYETAPFQKRMYEIAEDEQELLSVIASFRGSGKSTIMALAYPLWAILGKQQKKFVVLICDTQELAYQRLANIRSQLEHNALLTRELGPFKEDSGQWGAGSLVLLKYGARITAFSREQSIRGVTHDQYRPDLIILDDVESPELVKTKEGRDKMDRWFHNDVLPLGSTETKIVMIGNLLHEDSLIMRQKALIESGAMSGGYYAFPVRVGTHILWPGKYPDIAALKREQKKIGNDRAWLREFELRIIPEEDQIILPEWIKTYKHLPERLRNETTYLATGIDLALSKKSHADYTAMVTARIFVRDRKSVIYILPHPLNGRLNFPEQRQAIIDIAKHSGSEYHYLFIESFGTQGALVEELEHLGYKAEGVAPPGSKEERLRYVSHLVRNGSVLFPETGAEDLKTQLLGFGVETHDDLADAFAILLFKIMEHKHRGGFPGPIRISKASFYGWDRRGTTGFAGDSRRGIPGGSWRRLIG